MKQINIVNIFAIFGISIQAELNKAKSHPEVVQLLNGCKKRAKEQYKKMAFELHPDRGGDEDKFKELNAAFDILEKVGQKQRLYMVNHLLLLYLI